MPHAAVVVIGMAVALALAVLSSLAPVKALEQRLGVSVLLASGLPFLLMGTIFGSPTVGILSPDVLAHLRPAFEFGLGWIGFVVGMNFDVRKLDQLPRKLGGVIVIESIVPMLFTAGLCTLAFGAIAWSVSWSDHFVRDALILGACAAPSAPISVPFLTRALGLRPAQMVAEITKIDEVAALVALGLCAALFRPDAVGTTWVLPGSAWLLVTVGLGGVLGILTYILLRGASTRTEEMALLLGAVAISAGMAGYLALSVPVVCAVAGALLANLPLRDADGLRRTLHDVERPLYLVFLLIAGASWDATAWQGWIVAPVFVLARVLGKHAGAILSRRVGPDGLPAPRDLSMALMPQSPISIVAIVSAATLYAGDGSHRIGWAINAVIIGGVLTEVVIRVLQRADPRRYTEEAEARERAMLGEVREGQG
jgi:Kef-type K+ transport system membrane component KefB